MFILLEVIVNINYIILFLWDNVIYNIDKEDFIWYFKDFYFIFEEIFEIWSRFYEKLKRLGKEVKDVFKILENNVCFYLIFLDEVL